MRKSWEHCFNVETAANTRKTLLLKFLTSHWRANAAVLARNSRKRSFEFAATESALSNTRKLGFKYGAPQSLSRFGFVHALISRDVVGHKIVYYGLVYSLLVKKKTRATNTALWTNQTFNVKQVSRRFLAPRRHTVMHKLSRELRGKNRRGGVEVWLSYLRIIKPVFRQFKASGVLRE